MADKLKIGGHEFRPLPSGVVLPGSKAWGFMRGPMSYMFAQWEGVTNGEWFGASRCETGKRVQTIAFSKDRAVVELALAEQIARDTQ